MTCVLYYAYKSFLKHTEIELIIPHTKLSYNNLTIKHISQAQGHNIMVLKEFKYSHMDYVCGAVLSF